ncbi:exonuclease 1 [Ictidomys tridecemlineatus]|nr:exonuclease 1 [Ictidomys tridecemlineatus]
MGIQGLLQFIKEASEPINVRKYKGQVVAVDTYCWLHKGAISCAEKLAKGEPTDRYVGFCMKFVNMLLSHGVTPILVFDGCTLPSKKEVERSRRERRQANLLKGKQLLREGKVSEARECFTRCINITHAMAHKVIKVIKKIGHYLKMNITVPEDYIKGFIRANNTFLYQLVFDPIKRKLVPLNAYEDDIDPETLSYAGQYVDDSVALQIALGNKDINTFEQIDNYNPDTAMSDLSRSHSWNNKTCQKSSTVNSIWHRNYCPRLELDNVSGATQLKENPSTVGIKQVISTKGLNLSRKSSMVKRPRNEELSEDDLLNQYSLSFTKKIKKNSCENNESLKSSEMFVPALEGGTIQTKTLSTTPQTRNKFATFLQRKNKESGAVVVPGTRSRTPSPTPGTALQQLRRMSDSLAAMPENNAVPQASQSKSDESGGESPPLHDVERSSQSQESEELSSHSLNTSKLSQPSSKDSDSEVGGATVEDQLLLRDLICHAIKMIQNLYNVQPIAVAAVVFCMVLRATEVFYLLVNNKSLVSMNVTIAEIYRDYKDEECFAYMAYASQETFGSLGSADLSDPFESGMSPKGPWSQFIALLEGG